MRTFLLEYENADSLLTFWGGGETKKQMSGRNLVVELSKNLLTNVNEMMYMVRHS